MLLRILRKSLIKRKTRVAIAIISVILGAAMASALLTVSTRVEEKVAQELTKYGPNMVVVPKTEELTVEVGGIPLSKIGETKYISETDALKIKNLKQDDFGGKVLGNPNKNAFLYTVVNITTNDDSNEIILAGTWFDDLMKINTWWEISGSFPRDNSSVVIGSKASEKLNIGIDDNVLIEYRERIITETDEYDIYNSKEFRVVGVIFSGGEDDSRIFAELDAVQNLTNRENKVNIMHISAVCNACPVDDIAAIIEDNIPDIEVTTVKQVEKATMEILEDINNMMFLITIVALLASALGVMTTMTTSVVERTKEIGMMKAIGAEDSKIAKLFLSEAIIIGIIGGIAGYFIGIILARYIGESVFQSSINPNLIVLPIILGISIGVTILSSLLPIRRALKIEPAEVIRAV